MALLRKSKLINHKIEPIPGEAGRYRVYSQTAPDESYDVDVNSDECPCKGWSVRHWCSHLNSAHAYHAAALRLAEKPESQFEPE